VALDPTAIAVLFALACSTFWALANVYVQRAGRALGSLRALLYSQGIGSAVLLPFAWTFDAPLSAPALPDLVLTAAGSALGYYAMMEAFARGSLSGVVPMITAWAVPAAVAGVMWTGEWPGVQAAIGGAMIVVGAVGNGLLAPVPDGQRGTDRVALGWAAASALGFGVMVAGTARLRPALGDVGVVPAVWLAQWLLLLPLLLRRELRAWPPRDAWAPVLAMALFESAGFVAFTLAMRLAPVAVVSPPSSVSSLLTVLYASLVLGEVLSLPRWGLVGLAAAGTLLVAAA
jgi:drug/metabolite transporter (DMT)-like permease